MYTEHSPSLPASAPSFFLLITDFNFTMNQHTVFGPTPPQTTYPNITSALTACQDHARYSDYTVVIRSTERREGKAFRAYFMCDRSGKYRNRTKPSAKPRKKRTLEGAQLGTATCKTDCPFQLYLDRQDDDSWHLRVNQLAHNHPPSLNTAAHPSLRARDLRAHRVEVTRSINSRDSIRSIISKLRAQGARYIPRDIYNLGQRIRIESLRGLTPIQWLKEELDRQGYYNEIDSDPVTNKVRRLFYIHPTAIDL
jgi:hypothetical protein